MDDAEAGKINPGTDAVAEITHTVDAAAHTATFTVGNTPGVALPSTGGPGISMFYVLGSTLTLLALVLLVTKKRSDGAGIE